MIAGRGRPAALAVGNAQAQENPVHALAAGVGLLDGAVAEVAGAAGIGVVERAQPVAGVVAYLPDGRLEWALEKPVAVVEEFFILPGQILRRLAERFETLVEGGHVAGRQGPWVGRAQLAQVAVAVSIAPGILGFPYGPAKGEKRRDKDSHGDG